MYISSSHNLSRQMRFKGFWPESFDNLVHFLTISFTSETFTISHSQSYNIIQYIYFLFDKSFITQCNQVKTSTQAMFKLVPSFPHSHSTRYTVRGKVRQGIGRILTQMMCWLYRRGYIHSRHHPLTAHFHEEPKCADRLYCTNLMTMKIVPSVEHLFYSALWILIHSNP